MYNAKSIENFINKVNKEAEQAAQQVYNKYQKEYENRLLAQLKTGDRISAGNGSADIENSSGQRVGEKLGEVLTRNEYTSPGLTTPDLIKTTGP